MATNGIKSPRPDRPFSLKRAFAENPVDAPTLIDTADEGTFSLSKAFAANPVVQAQQAPGVSPELQGLREIDPQAFVPIQQLQQPATVAPPPQQEQLTDIFTGRQFTPEPRDVPPGILQSIGAAVPVAGRKTQLTQDLPEFQAIARPVDPETGRRPKESPGQFLSLISSGTPQEQVKLIAANFPGTRFFQDDKGNIFVQNKEGQSAVLNKPGLSKIDIAKGLFGVLTSAPAGRLALVGKTLFKRLGLGLAAEAATETGIQAAEAASGGEFNIEDVVINTAFAGLGELVSTGLSSGAKGILKRFRTKDITDTAARKELKALGLDESQADQIMTKFKEAQTDADKLAGATGGARVGLTPAQQTQELVLLGRQELLQKSREAGNAVKFLKNQNQEALDVAFSLIDRVAPKKSIDTASGRVVSAAKDTLKRATALRTERTSPLYEQAFKEQGALAAPGLSGLVATNKAKRELNTALQPFIKEFETTVKERFKGTNLSTDLQRLVTRVKEAKGDLRQLQDAKLIVDDAMERTGDTALNRSSKKFLADAQRKLVDALVDASPSYAKARQAFIKESAPIDVLRESTIGTLDRLDDNAVRRARSVIFNKETTPADVAATRKLIEAADPEAWNQIVRAELQHRIGEMENLGSAELVKNVPDQLNKAIFGAATSTKMQTLMKSLKPEVAKNFQTLRKVLNRASTGRLSRPKQLSDSELLKELSGKLSVFKDSLMTPFRSAFKLGDSRALTKSLTNLSEAMLNPKWTPRFNEILKQSRTGKQDAVGTASRALAQLIDDIAASGEADPQLSTLETP